MDATGHGARAWKEPRAELRLGPLGERGQRRREQSVIQTVRSRFNRRSRTMKPKARKPQTGSGDGDGVIQLL